MRLASGSDAINLSQNSYTISSPTGEAAVLSGNNNTAHITFYQKQSLEDGTRVLKDQEDLMVVNIDLTEANGVSPLEEAEKYSLITQAPAGGQTFKQVKTPRNVEADSSYILS
ncbi:MAG: hypothetical protein J07HN4v3_03052 [Halonotius sp. J07HN4]|nr:MAG: hypothetical protein J07HN4v3_03052 [Halonotius sp. J07HN4]